MRYRIIPILLLKGSGLYKTRKFSADVYIGDPINAVKIFNEKEVDELALLDISAARNGSGPDFTRLKSIVSECFLPLSYGGGVNSVDMVRELTNIGIEKVIVNTAAVTNPGLVNQLAERFGNSTIIGSIDVKKNWFGKDIVYIRGGKERTKYTATEWAVELVRRGVGEILINSIDRDGEMTGYDIDLIRSVSSSVSVPVIAAGGARGVYDFKEVIVTGGASAAAAGAVFVFQGKHRAVLISYPDPSVLSDLWKEL